MCREFTKAFSVGKSSWNDLYDVPKGIDSHSLNTLLVSFQELEQVEADIYPFTRRDKLCTTISNTTDQTPPAPSRADCVKWESYAVRDPLGEIWLDMNI